MRIIRVKAGSVVLVTEGTREGFERLETLLAQGQLSERLGLVVEAIRWERYIIYSSASEPLEAEREFSSDHVSALFGSTVASQTIEHRLVSRLYSSLRGAWLYFVGLDDPKSDDRSSAAKSFQTETETPGRSDLVFEPAPNRRRFTLIEGMVVIACISVTCALVLPFSQSAREASRRLQCTNNLKQIGLAMANYQDTFGCYPPGRIPAAGITSADESANPWGTMANELGFRALILPQMEANNAYNAFNFATAPIGVTAGTEQYTAWNTVFTSWLCPSDPNNGGGRVTNGYYSANQKTANWGPSPINPATGTYSPTIPVSNYAGSFGDNYCGGVLAGPGLPWETPWNVSPPIGQARLGWNGYWGTSFGGTSGFVPGMGAMRGFFDYSGTQKPPNIASVTDGTSNTIITGEVLPSNAADNTFWMFNGSYAGTTVPLGFNSNFVIPVAGSSTCSSSGWQNPAALVGCRFGSSAKGFISSHPGGANFAFADGSVHFLKNGINQYTYNVLGSRSGGEVLSSDAY